MNRGIVSYLNGQLVQIRDRQDQTVEFVNTDLLAPNMISAKAQTLFITKTGSPDAINLITDWVNNNGVTSAIPFQKIESQTGLVVFDGFLDPNSVDTFRGFEHNAFSDYERFADLANTFKLQELRPRPDTDFTFQELKNLFNDQTSSEAQLRAQYNAEQIAPNLQITNADLYDIKYLDREFRILDVLVLYISLFYLITEIVKAVKAIADAGGTVSLTMVATTAIYVAFLTINLVTLVQQIIDAVPKVKKSKGVTIKTLIEKGSAALNFNDVQFTSSVGTDNPENLVIWHSINQPIPNTNLKEFIDNYCTIWNRKPVVYDANISPTSARLIEFRPLKDWWATPATDNQGNVYVIPALQAPDPIQKNLKDMATSYSFSFLRDNDGKRRDKGQEFNITFREDGTFLREPLTGADKNINIDYSRAYVKTELTQAEKTYNTLVDVINTVSLGVFGFLFGGGSVNNLKISQDNVGAVQLENDFLSSPKLLKLNLDNNDGKPTADNLEVVNASYIYSKNHDYMNPNEYGQWEYFVANREDRDLKINTNVDAAALIKALIQNPVCDYEYVDENRQRSIRRCVIRQFKRNAEKRTNMFVLATRPYPQKGGVYSTKEWKPQRSVE